MNDQLQAALAAILGKTVQGIEAGVSFLSGQLPDVIEQLLIWKFAEACLWIALGLVALTPAIVLIVGLTRKQVKLQEEEDVPARWSRTQYVPTFFRDRDGDVAEIVIFIGIISAFLVLFGAVTVVFNTAVAVQIWLAPKVYLIEYAASLAKGG